MRRGQVGDHSGEIGSPFGVLLLCQLRGFGTEISLLRVELVEGVAVKHALLIDSVGSIADFGDSCADGGAVLQAGNQILDALEHIRARGGE